MAGGILGVAVLAVATLPGCSGTGAPGVARSGEVPAVERFAAAMDIRPSAVSAVTVMPVPEGKELLVGLIAEARGGLRAEIIAFLPCGGDRLCRSGSAHLDEVDGGQTLTVDIMAMIDLAAAPKSLSLAGNLGGTKAPTAPGRAPALLLRTRRGIAGPGGTFQSESLLLVALGAPLAVLAKEEICRRGPNGAGFATTELSFESAPGGASAVWPDLVLVQHALPARSAPEQLPGPPLKVRLRATSVGGKADGGVVYRRMDPPPP